MNEDRRPQEDRLDAAAEALERQWHEPLFRYAELLSGCLSARLTGTRETGALYDLHVRDCLASVPLLPDSGSVIDVGSGGGLPGVVWAVCRPDLRVVLLDSVAKKCRATGEIVRALGLGNVELLCERSEDTARTRRETFALAAARAVARAGVAAEYLSPLVAVGGRLLTFKGPKAVEELAEAKGRWSRLGLREPAVLPYGPEESNLCFVIWEKAAPCPAEYPRRAGAASLKGWWL